MREGTDILMYLINLRVAVFCIILTGQRYCSFDRHDLKSELIYSIDRIDPGP